MSILQSKLTSEILKNKFQSLLESLDKDNAAKHIVTRYYNQLDSQILTESNISNASQYYKTNSDTKSNLLNNIITLQNSVKELKAYDWVVNISYFIDESNQFFKDNQTYIYIESCTRQLQNDLHKNYYATCISKLHEASESKNPNRFIVESFKDAQWIPLIKQLFEHAKNQLGEIDKTNPTFEVSKIYSPVELINENSWLFVNSGKLLEFSNDSLSESTNQASNDFISLYKLVESSKITDNCIRLYPSNQHVIDVIFENEETKVLLNDKLVESTGFVNSLLANNIVKLGETDKLSNIGYAITDGSKIKEIDFGYKIKSAVYEGFSCSVFSLNDKIWIQKYNKGMNENSLIKTNSITEAVEIVKDFIGYDISDQFKSLLEKELAVVNRKKREITEITEKIQFLNEKLSGILKAEGINGPSEVTKQAKNYLISELNDAEVMLSKFSADVNSVVINSVDGNKFDPQTAKLPESGLTPISSVDVLVVGKEYTIKGQCGYMFIGNSTDDLLFNHKNLVDPAILHINVSDMNNLINQQQVTQ